MPTAEFAIAGCLARVFLDTLKIDFTLQIRTAVPQIAGGHMRRSRKIITTALGPALLLIAAFTIQPYAPQIDADATLIDGQNLYQPEKKRLIDGTLLVAVRTAMPNVTADMVHWWFSDFLQTTEHYKWWHPTDHVWMDWENKTPGEIYGASHLVHEYIGGEMGKLRIQFVPPQEFFGRDPNDADTFVLCARVGLLEEPVNVTRMCHVIRNTAGGAEMRSRFWLGHVAARDGNELVASPLNLIGNSWLSRQLLLNNALADDLFRHATEEMAFLATLLPPLYAAQTQ